ncbi:hypothetical protein B0H17DRAFT_1330547 [Mycena rosella]|uniref:Uncharacterized protein n=1 Tax=Mycena rosella TaxID=1033263 RepID=A0AAD7GG87_MYCRO|nr:hypothetical protein B0H17DRAFT_1330547 [Mycena rosella]
MLNKLPSIVELAILPHKNTKTTFISTLTADLIGSAIVAPQLRKISLGLFCDKDSSNDYTMCLEMLEFRWRAEGYALEAASLLTDSGPGPNPVTLAGLEILRQDGLDLSLLAGKEARNSLTLVSGFTVPSDTKTNSPLIIQPIFD